VLLQIGQSANSFLVWRQCFRGNYRYSDGICEKGVLNSVSVPVSSLSGPYPDVL
jgi:hypothetical protein